MNLRRFTLAMLATCGTARAVEGGAPLPRTDDEILADPLYVVAAVVVESARPQVGTYGLPPRVSLRIEATLRGALPATSIEAVWRPPEWVDDSIGPSRWWLDTALAAPSPGARLIVLIARYEGEFHVPEACRFADTPEMRGDIRKRIAQQLARERAWALQVAREKRAAKRRLDVRRRAWRATATPAVIARAAREADVVGIGHVVSGPNRDVAGFYVSRLLKGTARMPSTVPGIFADVRIHPVALDLVADDRSVKFLLFLDEDGARFVGSSATYPATGPGVVLADAEAVKVVRDTLATRGRVPVPFCLVMVESSAGAADAGRALGERITAEFTGAGKGLCAVGSTSILTDISDPAGVGARIRPLFPNARGAVLVSVQRDGRAVLSGIRQEEGQTHVAFSGEPWPATTAEQHTTARRLLATLVAAE